MSARGSRARGMPWRQRPRRDPLLTMARARRRGDRARVDICLTMPTGLELQVCSKHHPHSRIRPSTLAPALARCLPLSHHDGDGGATRDRHLRGSTSNRTRTRGRRRRDGFDLSPTKGAGRAEAFAKSRRDGHSRRETTHHRGFGGRVPMATEFPLRPVMPAILPAGPGSRRSADVEARHGVWVID